METKPFWASKTLWVNGLTVVAAIAASFGLEVGPEMQAEVVAIAMGVVNIVLRVITKTTVG